jgi:hypothetical protein
MEQLIRQLQAGGRFRPEDDETDVVFFFPRPASAFRGHGLINTISQDFPRGNLVTAYTKSRGSMSFSAIERMEISKMTTQSEFTPEEWTLLGMVPSFVAGGVSFADPSGIFGSIKEAAAGMR